MTPTLWCRGLAPAVVALAVAMAAPAARSQDVTQDAAQVVDLPTRPGVRLRMLVLPPPAAASPADTVVLLPGGAGRVGVHDNGSLRFATNFLVRSRALFAGHGHAVVVLDVPSDRRDLTGDFRESAEHAADLGAAIAWARGRFGRPVWAVGTSRGTHSAALAGTTLRDAQAPDGLVLSSTILAPSRPGANSTARPVPEMALERLQVPVLVVHHQRDACPVCPPSQLPRLMARLPGGRGTLLTFDGGRSEGADCEALAHHGFNGIEAQVVAAISAWIGGHR